MLRLLISGVSGQACFTRTYSLGVVYFDTGSAVWQVKDLRGHIYALSTLPIPAREAFTFYDESRCRGADIQLKTSAVAVLTLCPRLSKSALMQLSQ